MNSKVKLTLLISTSFIVLMYALITTIYKSDDLDLNKLNSEQMITWGIKKIKADNVWEKSTGKEVKVAVLDTGFDFEHEDFGKNVKNGFNVLEPSKLPIDDVGHGTMVSGIICSANNNIGIVGVSPDVELYPVKVLDEFGEGDISDICKGIEWCIENDIQIINMSFAIKDDNIKLRNAIKKAEESNIIIVASVMNPFENNVGYPASYDNVISVSSVDKELEPDITLNPKGKVDFVAPGYDIISTSLNNTYEKSYGNSLATPYITGCIALMFEKSNIFDIEFNSPNILSEVKNSLTKYCVDLKEKDYSGFIGNGFVSLNFKERRGIK